MSSGIMEKDSLFYVREKVWHGLGVHVEQAPNSKEALELAKLNWKVIPKPLFIETSSGMIEVPNSIANVCDEDDTVLGIVSSKYKIVQNEEAFNFCDTLLGEGITFETAGSLFNRKTIWLLAKMPDIEILGDKVEPYMVISNSHDGKGSIHVACTPVRVCCNNTLNLALAGAKRTWSTKHMGNLESKMAEAHRTLELATKYNEQFKATANFYANKKFSTVKFNQFVEKLYPTSNENTEKQNQNLIEQRDDLSLRYFDMQDLNNLRGTAYGILNAVSDSVYHKAPLRTTDTYQEKLFSKAIDGHPVMDRALELIEEMV